MSGFLFLVIVFFVGITAFHLLELVNPVMPHYRSGVTRRGYLADVMSLIINGPGLDGLTTVAAVGLVLLLPPQLKWMPKLPWGWQFVIFFVVNDFLRYWIHRWYHDSSWLWRVHRVHHTVVEMDSMSLFRFHILEGVVKNCVITLPFQLAGVNTWVMVIYSALDILKGFWHHANLKTYIGPLNYLFNSPELHWWHHSIEARGQHSNYGSVLSIWDWLFGTAYWPRGKWPDRIGVEGMEGFSDSYVGQFLSVAYDDRQIVADCRQQPGVAVSQPSPAALDQAAQAPSAHGAAGFPGPQILSPADPA